MQKAFLEGREKPPNITFMWSLNDWKKSVAPQNTGLRLR